MRYSLLATAILLATGPAWAGDGSLGDDSTGSSAIDLTLLPAVKLTNVGDLTIAPTAAQLGAPVVTSDNVCVYSNVTSSRTYKVTASGDGSSSAFTVTDGAGSPTLIAYTVKFNNATGGGGTTLTATTQSNNFTGGANNYDCSGGPNASFEVTFAATDLQAAYAGNYDGILTLLISPGT